MKLTHLPHRILNCNGRILDLSQPQIMGILNVTPDSFSDGGYYNQVEYAIKHAKNMILQGASIIDIGGESTRPGASVVAVEDEINRVIPVVKALSTLDIVLSIDTSEPEVMKAAMEAGAHIWNDVRALTRPGALEMAAELNIPVILMHMRGEPTTMNQLACYDDVVSEVINELKEKIVLAQSAGIQSDHIIIDPGFGFAKNTTHNTTLLNNLWRLHELGYPILSGLSRKRFIGEITQCSIAAERVVGSVTGHLLSVQQGASVVRVHDVEATAQALLVWKSLMSL
ncbi:dihydropteroate synthase [Acinetobacter sp. B5B]|uniref:dihydropteroate synthase n=1 Tax=Acinetobacter baretiae TaxID=2605383 RepID=UPI0018C1DB5B|nr:dihydropteroate synthase [Acinetobacter baretiae]MBF7683562.1 dihydropteroate synthase [Acinetobacter baretiae]MBF7686123.1 dihydropteroate synthase [Acinetobacter baretiae]